MSSKGKSLTLLELCQTLKDFRCTTSRSTSQILTRRLYLHPLSLSTNAKQYLPAQSYREPVVRRSISLSRKVPSSTKFDVWQSLTTSLQRPTPPDPTTTPLDFNNNNKSRSFHFL